jgi:hypothetical protein
MRDCLLTEDREWFYIAITVFLDGFMERRFVARCIDRYTGMLSGCRIHMNISATHHPGLTMPPSPRKPYSRLNDACPIWFPPKPIKLRKTDVMAFGNACWFLMNRR